MLNVLTPVSVHTATPLVLVIWPVFVMVIAYGPVVAMARCPVPSINPLFTITALPPTIENPSFVPDIVPALVNVPPRLASMALLCSLTRRPLAVLTKVTEPEKYAPRPLCATIEPVLVTRPGEASSDTMPCPSDPNVLIDPLFVSVVLPDPAEPPFA